MRNPYFLSTSADTKKKYVVYMLTIILNCYQQKGNLVLWFLILSEEEPGIYIEKHLC